MKISTHAKVTLLVLLVLALPSAAAEETKKITDSSIEGEILAGPQWYVREDPNDSAKFLEYRDVPNGFVLERLLFSWERGGGRYLDLAARDVGQLDQRVWLDLGKQDVWKFRFAWAENPRRWTDHANQLFTHHDHGVFMLEDAFQAAVQAAPASADTTPADGEWDAGTKGALIKSAVQTSAPDVSVGWQRETASIGAEFTPTRHWTFSVDAQRERRTGTAPQSLGMYFALSPAEVAAPLDFRTDDARVGAEYASRHFNVGARAIFSEFETGTDRILWDDQLFLTDVAVNATTANPGRMQMSPWSDNRLFKWEVYGGADFAGHSRVSATFSRNTTTQDDPFLPKTVNTLLIGSTAPLPASSLDGKHEISFGSVSLSSRPLSWLRYSAWFRDYHFDNQTPSLVFTDYVMTDYQIPLCGNANACGATTNPIQRRSLPYSYEKTNLGASAGFQPLAWLGVTAAFDREGLERNVAAVTDSDEDSFKLALDFDLSDSLTLRVWGRHQERRADEYDAEYFEESFPIGEANIAAANEGERKYLWTDRDRDMATLTAEFSPGPKLTLFSEATLARDDYLDPNTGKKIGESFTVTEDRNFDTIDETYVLLLAGRIDDKITTYAVGGRFTPSDRWNLYADYTWEDREYRMASRYRNVSGGIGTDNPLDDWGSDSKDRYDTANAGFNFDLTKDRRWRLDGAYTWSKGTGEIETHFVPGGAASGDTTLTEFPRVKTTLAIAQTGLTCALRENLDFAFRYWYEKWHERNFASDFNRAYMGDPGNDPGSREAVYLGLDFEDYSNHILSFLLRYRF
ncbi:MAG TPA: MtrB/PioB family outer membrane beta-barrel protein [Candidatus Polarisedimenticolia bacterium]|jgi:MtrB/PioB family decaheme-associated outer membrane protein|nr:MtrB/PioB family outer membrane beta-barrel protein [Candidatus Polarisedimenticolia bacterium]